MKHWSIRYVDLINSIRNPIENKNIKIISYLCHLLIYDQKIHFDNYCSGNVYLIKQNCEQMISETPRRNKISKIEIYNLHCIQRLKRKLCSSLIKQSPTQMFSYMINYTDDTDNNAPVKWKVYMDLLLLLYVIDVLIKINGYATPYVVVCVSLFGVIS